MAQFLIKNDSEIFQDKRLNKLHMLHGITSRDFGKFVENRVIAPEKVLKVLGVIPNAKQLHWMKQVHGVRVEFAIEGDMDPHLYTDALLTKDQNNFLLVFSADCVPVILTNTKTVAGAIHLGWKGALNNIISEVISRLDKKEISEVYFYLGPSIRSCCYSIEKDRIDLFKEAYLEEYQDFLEKRAENYYLSLQNMIKSQLVKNGVEESMIIDADVCTSCNNDDFFSYRKEGNKETYGTFGTFIGFV